MNNGNREQGEKYDDDDDCYDDDDDDDADEYRSWRTSVAPLFVVVSRRW